MCQVALPNQEIAVVYRKEILQKLERLIPQPTAIQVQEAILPETAKTSEVNPDDAASICQFFDTAGENFYHGFMLRFMCISRK